MAKKGTKRKATVSGAGVIVETKAAKFSRLASARVTVAVKRISLIGNLAGSGYEYTEEQVDKIRQLLNEAVVAAMARFVAKNKTGDTVTQIQI